MSAWTKFATNFFHQKQKQNAGYKFSQALKEASKVYKKTKGGSSKNCRGGDSVTGIPVPGTATATEEVEDINQKKYSFNEDATDFLEDSNGNLYLKNLHDMIGQSRIDDVVKLNAMKKKFNELDEFKKLTETEQEDMKFVLNDEVVTNTPLIDPSTGSKGGKKSKRKSKKAGKKSQKKSKKSKKAGSKKSKK
jgi:hypothetical protein